MLLGERNVDLAHFGIGREPARGQHHALCRRNFAIDAVDCRPHTGDPAITDDQPLHRGILEQINPGRQRRMEQPARQCGAHGQARTAAQLLLVEGKADGDLGHIPQRTRGRQSCEIGQIEQIDHHAARRVEFLTRFGKPVEVLTKLFAIKFGRRQQAAMVCRAGDFRIPVTRWRGEQEMHRAVGRQPLDHRRSSIDVSVNQCLFSPVANHAHGIAARRVG